MKPARPASSARTPRWLQALKLSAMTTLLASSACVSNEVSLLIQGNLIPVPSGANMPCVTLPNAQAQTRNDGLLDLSLRTNYIMYPLYRSGLISNADLSAGRPETRGIIIDGAVVSLHAESPTGPEPDLGPDAPASTYTVYASAFVPPSTAGSAGYGVGTLEVIPSVVGASLKKIVCTETAPVAPCVVPRRTSTPTRVLAVIKPFGHTMGGVSIQGGSFNFPINFCCRCLLQFPGDADDPATAYPDCTKGTAVSTSCTPGQDDALDCRSCAGGVATCQPERYMCP